MKLSEDDYYRKLGQNTAGKDGGNAMGAGTERPPSSQLSSQLCGLSQRENLSPGQQAVLLVLGRLVLSLVWILIEIKEPDMTLRVLGCTPAIKNKQLVFEGRNFPNLASRITAA